MAITDKKQHWLDVIFRDRVELPGSEGVLLPRGSNGQRPVPPKLENGYLRYNTDAQEFEVYKFGTWTFLNTGGGTGGEANDGVNVGTGEEVFKDKLGTDLRFRTLSAGSSMITITLGGGGDEILIDSIAATLFVAKAGDQMTGDLEMLTGAQVLLDRNGTPANASLGFYTDAATGIFQTNGGGGPPWFGYISITNNGMHTWDFTAAGDILPVPTNTGKNLGSPVDYLTSVNSNLYRANDGLGATPSYTFIGFPGTGMWRDATGYLGFSVSGTPRWKITTAGDLEPETVGYNVGSGAIPVNNVHSRYYLGDPSTSAFGTPTYTWDGDTTTGMYRPGPGTIGFAIAITGTVLEVDTAGVWLVPTGYEDLIDGTSGGPTPEALTNKQYVDEAIAAGAAQDYELAFDDGVPQMGAVLADHLEVTHNLGQQYPTVAVWDDNNTMVYPNIISIDPNTIRIDFTGGWRPLSGGALAWHVKVVG